ncbi:hypothetical protein I302_105539 [Kwoniella bestiolae CBS 10118]|uniref:RNA polymerase II subunit B1 CTD phosphatase RPAP2 homolog n=1 Tax=Kwoniella bestiolae CBS 10118 TaxID=1296100 RepID=A0A1B9FTE9_9TREE|nr:hypothetical protein I302_08822 [Kwoniella bestiolae CBS 10118]OCF22041.1 hypothetical protein I302_08822 [Kwoniella bestiolae CBS 10118]
MSSQPNAAGPSNTSRNPVKLSVAQRSSHHQEVSTQGDDEKGEHDILVKAAVRKAQLQRRVDRWMDKLMEETVDRAPFKKITSHLTPSQYQELTHERHLNFLCSYPLCANKPKREYSDKKRLSISTKNRTIKEKQGNPEDGFCSPKCTKKSEWVESNLSEEAVWLRTEIREVELLEELEERGLFTWPEDSKNAKKSGTSQISSNGVKSRNPSSDVTKVVTTMKTPSTSQPPIPQTPPTLSKPENPVSALIARLTIHERPTPSTPPIAPSLSQPTPSYSSPPPNSVQPHRQVHPQSSPSKNTTAPVDSPRESRRAQSALIGSSSKQLSNTFVNASKSLGPIGIAQGDSDAEEESEASDWDQEVEGGWDDEEMKGFWEEARLAREMVDEEQGDQGE